MVFNFEKLLGFRWVSMPFEAYAYAVWPARHDISLYDAGYVALAQKTRFPLITLDRKLAAIALRSCEIATPNGYRGNGEYFRNRRRLGVHLFELAGVVRHRPRPP